MHHNHHVQTTNKSDSSISNFKQKLFTRLFIVLLFKKHRQIASRNLKLFDTFHCFLYARLWRCLIEFICRLMMADRLIE
jgi:hypothetical protein